jgi:hypothetical protein
MVDTLIRFYATFLQVVGLLVALVTTYTQFGAAPAAYFAAVQLFAVGALIERPYKT